MYLIRIELEKSAPLAYAVSIPTGNDLGFLHIMDPAPATQMDTRTGHIEPAFFFLLLAIVAVAPIPLGSNRPIPAALLGFMGGTLLIAWIVTEHSRSRPKTPASTLRTPLLLYAAVCLWIALQAAVWVPSVLIDPIWNVAQQQLTPDLAAKTNGSISINPTATLTELMHMLTYLAFFWLAYQLARVPSRARKILTAVSSIVAAYSFFGIVVYFAGDDAPLFLTRWMYLGNLASTFANRNNYATFAGLGVLCSLSLLINSLEPLLRQRHSYRRLAARVIEHLLVHNRGRLATLLISAIALALSASRGGMVATLCGATVLSLILLRKSAPRGKRSFILASILCLATLVGNVAGTQLSDRLSEQSVDIDADGRLNIYLLTLEAIGTAPWTGVGAGAYQDAIAAYKSDTFLHSIAVTKAHNTYLENALELGIPAALCLLAAITLLARETLTGIARRRRGIYLPATGTAASVLVGVHALVDFSLQIPAVTILYAVILGAAVAQSRPPRNESQLIRPSAPETPRAEAR